MFLSCTTLDDAQKYRTARRGVHRAGRATTATPPYLRTAAELSGRSWYPGHAYTIIASMVDDA